MTTLGDALLGLDIKTAIKDVRRFAYVIKIIQILLLTKFHSLSGRAQMFILELIREVVKEVLTTGNQTRMAKDLLAQLGSTLDEHKYNHIGGDALWLNHSSSLREMNDLIEKNSSDPTTPMDTANLESLGRPRVRLRGTHSASYSSFSSFNQTKRHISESSQEKLKTLQYLPDECIDMIIFNLQMPKDLETLGTACPLLSTLINDDLVWRRIVYQNFNEDQIKMVMSWGISSDSNHSESSSGNEIQAPVSWKRVYKRLLVRFGTFYPAKIGLCYTCSSLFWNVSHS
ncbi:F-box only protein 32 [Cichlidogyrus casuarinus]|uniref:F-box only protein 32 n=1 Tax=Cichlidogyrus casuarinus TaxID=1844966 RepID=A0ABD2QFF0_9PLAT